MLKLWQPNNIYLLQGWLCDTHQSSAISCFALYCFSALHFQPHNLSPLQSFLRKFGSFSALFPFFSFCEDFKCLSSEFCLFASANHQVKLCVSASWADHGLDDFSASVIISQHLDNYYIFRLLIPWSKIVEIFYLWLVTKNHPTFIFKPGKWVTCCFWTSSISFVSAYLIAICPQLGSQSYF